MSDADATTVTYFIGLDLGQVGQFSALAVLERRSDGDDAPADYSIRHLERFPPGCSYAEIQAAVGRVFATPGLDRGTLVVDVTAAGRPVFDRFRKGLPNVNCLALAVTSGHLALIDELGGRQVPKKDLVGTLQLLFQDRRLKVSEKLEHAAIFLTELQHFRLRAVPLNADAVLDWRDRPHDDLVLAVAVAAWLAERGTVKVDVWCFHFDPPPEPRRWWSHW